MNAITSSFGLAKQTAKGTPAAETGATWFLATDQSAGAQPRIRQLPFEMGAGTLGRGLVKTGVSGMAALSGVPRPESLGHILLGLLGEVTSADQTGYYTHTFKINTTDPVDVPYYTAFREVGNAFGEQVDDVRVAALTMDMAATNFVTGDFALAGITPALVTDTSGWTPDPDDSPRFVACSGAVKVETGDTITTLPVRAASLTFANGLAVDENFVIGSYYPQDIDVLRRVITVELVVLVKDIALYRKAMYDPAEGSSWLPDVFETSQVEHLTFKTAENIPGQAVPYSLAVTVEKAHWVAAPISLRGTDNVLVRLTGSVVQTDGADPITVVLTNETTAY